MLLDNNTFERVKGLFKIPINKVSYCGSWKDSVVFEVGWSDESRNLLSGVMVYVSADFNINKVERLTVTWGRHTRKQPTVKEKFPLHPAGQIPSIYRD